MSPLQQLPNYPHFPKSPPTTLPIEIICHILSFLSNPELGQSAQLSHAWYEHATRILYKHVRLALWNTRGRIEDPEQGIPLLHWSCKATPRILSPPYPGSTLRDRFALTETLTIFPHTHLSCSAFPPLSLPNLVTLRIMPVLNEPDVEIDYFLNVCRCPHIRSYYIGHPCAEYPGCVCPLLVNLRPRRVIFGGTDGSLHGAAAGLWTRLMSDPPSSVKEVVVIVGVQSSNAHGASDMELFYSLPDTVHRLTLVMSTWLGRCEGDHVISRSERMKENYYEGCDDSDEDDGGEEGDEADPPVYRWLRNRLRTACASKAGVTEVVGWETVNPEWSKEEVAQGIKDIRGQLKAYFMEIGWKEADADRKVEAVAFIEGEEYLSRDGDMAMKQSRAAVMAAIREDAGPF